MKVTIYIEKKNFDTFFTWLNRINQGVISQRPLLYSTSSEGFNQPLQISLTANEYAAIQDTEADLEKLQEEIGGELYFAPEPVEIDKIAANGIIKKAHRHDMLADIVMTALELTSYIPGITPLEALVIAEREWIGEEKNAEPEQDW
jgi:hypothetical protein